MVEGIYCYWPGRSSMPPKTATADIPTTTNDYCYYLSTGTTSAIGQALTEAACTRVPWVGARPNAQTTETALAGTNITISTTANTKTIIC